MENKTGFFEEAPGVKSSQRLIYVIGMCFSMLTVGGIVALKTFSKLEVQWTELGIFAGILFGIFTTGKLFQKGQEKSVADVKPTDPPKP